MEGRWNRKGLNVLVEHILNEVQDFSTKPDKNIVRNENMNHPIKTKT